MCWQKQEGISIFKLLEAEMEPKHSHHEIRLHIRADHAVYIAVHEGSLHYALQPVSGTHHGRVEKAEFL